MNILNKKLSLKYDIIVTLINGIIVIGGIFILNGLIARLHGLNVLGEFLLIKNDIIKHGNSFAWFKYCFTKLLE